MIGRFGIRYKQGGKELTVDSELLAGKGGVAIFAESVKEWDSPFDGEHIPQPQQEEILRNIIDALNFMKVKATLIKP